MLLENPDFGDIDIWVPAPGENEVIACFESQAGLCKPAGSFVAGVEKTVAAEKATADGTLQPALSPPGGDVELAYGLQGVGSDKGRLARWVKGFHQFYCTESPAYVSPPNGGDESAPGPLQETGPVQQSGQGAGAMAAPAEGAAGCNETGNTDGHTPSIKVQVLVLLPGKHVTDAVAHFDLTCVQVFARFSHGAHGEGQGEGGPKDALEAAEGAAPTLSADIVARFGKQDAQDSNGSGCRFASAGGCHCTRRPMPMP